METLFSDKPYSINDNTCVTVGTFDGVHRGHSSVLDLLKDVSTRQSLKSLVFTFNKHPRYVLKKDETMLKLLNTSNEKSEILKNKNIDYMFIQDFNPEFYSLSAEDFIKNILLKKMKMKTLIVGYDHFFGHEREGGIEQLMKLSKTYNFEILRLPAIYDSGITVSSTKIRKALSEGDVDLAKTMLGYNYFFSGKVIHGDEIGRTLGFPTANIEIDSNEKLLPANGVYIVNVHIDKKMFHGMLNLGTKPTFNSNKKTIEVNLLDFNDNIYNKPIKVDFLLKIRNEKKFNSKEELSLQLANDKEKTQNYFNNQCHE